MRKLEHQRQDAPNDGLQTEEWVRCRIHLHIYMNVKKNTQPDDKSQITEEKVRDILLNINFHLQKADTKWYLLYIRSVWVFTFFPWLLLFLLVLGLFCSLSRACLLFSECKNMMVDAFLQEVMFTCFFFSAQFYCSVFHCLSYPLVHFAVAKRNKTNK